MRAPSARRAGSVVPLLVCGFAIGAAVADAAPIIIEEKRPVGEGKEVERTAEEVAGAPVAGKESGRVDPPGGDSMLRVAARAVLLVPRALLHLGFAPIRGGVWAFDHYQIGPRAVDVLFDDTRTYGIYPTLLVESDYGARVGARFVHRDLFGASEHLTLSAGVGTSTGGREVSGRLRSGDRFGERLELALVSAYTRRFDDPFYGVGNADEVEVGEVPSDEGAIETRYEQRVARATVVGDVRMVGDLYLRGASTIADFDYDRSNEGPPIDLVYRMPVVGFAGFRHAYLEGELRWDTRRPGSRWDPRQVRSTGWLLLGFAGAVVPIENTDDYWRYGLDVQRFFRISEGPRTISARLYGEAVTGSIDEVPFSQLPRLGGKTLLRGYPRDRFHDRVSAMGSVEYAWDLSQFISASTFVDVGRVFPSVSDLELDGLRVGFGIGLEWHSRRTFLARGILASSIDGSVFVSVAFDPVFDLEPREARR